MKEAFSYMFKDNKFIEKASVYFGFALLANLLMNFAQARKDSVIGLILTLLGYLVLCVPSGYGIYCIKALMNQKENFVLPYLNVKNNFVLGFKLFLAGCLLGLAVALIFLVIGIIGGLTLPRAFAPIVFGIAVIILSILFTVFGLAMTGIFAKKEWYTAFFRFGEAAKLISAEPKKYFIGILLYVLTFVLLMILFIISAALFSILGTTGTILFSVAQALLSSYTIYVFAYITANSVHQELIA